MNPQDDYQKFQQQILRRLDFHSERLTKFDKATENMVQMCKIVERLDNKVNGNGSIGLDEMVRENQKEIAVLKEISKAVQPMITFYKVGVWFASAIGLLVIALIWGLLTGQVFLHFGP